MTDKVEEFIRGLRAGEPRAVEAADRLLGTMAHTFPPTHLTDRQEEALLLVARGFTDAGIGLQMGISTLTAKEHVLNAKRALGARTRAHAVVLWMLRQRDSAVVRTPHGHRGNGAGECSA